MFPQSAVQTSIVNLIRNSLAFVSWKDRRKVMLDLKAIYRADTAEAALARLNAFEAAEGALSGGRARLAARLGACGADVRLPAGDPEAALHDG